MDIELHIAIIQDAATKGFHLSTELLAYPNQIGIEHEAFDRMSGDVASTSAVLQQFVDAIRWNHSGITLVTQVTAGAILASDDAVRACDNAFDNVSKGLRAASSSVTASKSFLTEYVPPLVGQAFDAESARKHSGAFLRSQDSLHGTLDMARKTLMLVTEETTLAYSKTLTELGKPDILDNKVRAHSTNNIRTSECQSETSNYLKSKTKDESAPCEAGIDPGNKISDQSATNLFPTTPAPRLPTTSNPQHGFNRAMAVGPDPLNGNRKFKSSTRDYSFTLGSSVTNNDQTPRKKFIDGALNGPNHLPDPLETIDLSDDSILEACTIMPTFSPTPCGYNVSWVVTVMPLEESEVKKELQRLQEMDSRNVCQQLDSLMWKERSAIEDFIANEPQLPTRSRFPHQDHIVLLAVVVESTESEEELQRLLGCASTRRVKIVIKTKRWSDKPGIMSSKPNSYPWIRVHRKHMSTRVLNDRGLPWEWDFIRPDHIIIKSWIPESLQDQLFERSRDIRGAQSMAVNASPSFDPPLDSGRTLEQDQLTNAVTPKRKFCKPLTNVFARLGFIKHGDRDRDSAKENKSRSDARLTEIESDQRNPDLGDREKTAEPWKTRMDTEIEIEELERQRIEHRIQKRYQERFSLNSSPSTPRIPPPYQRSRPGSNMTLPPKTAHLSHNIAMHLDPDSGLQVPNEPIPDFGASLMDLAFDDRTVTSVLNPNHDKTSGKS